MTRLLLVFLVSSAVAMYNDPGQIAVQINHRQMELYNHGDYEQLVQEVYSIDAIIRNAEGLIVAIGPGQILQRLRRFSGTINQAPISYVKVKENGVIEALVEIDHTDRRTGETRQITHKQRILNGKIIEVIQSGMN